MKTLRRVSGVDDDGKVCFNTAADLMLQLAAAKSQGRPWEYFNCAVVGPKLLIVDETGYLPFGREAANLFFNRLPSGTAPSPTTRR